MRLYNYARVVPRDLFNEGDLLKCLGRFTLLIEEHRAPDIVLDHTGGPFYIVQDDSDGSISVGSMPLKVRGRNITLFRPLNARLAWPLMAADDTLSNVTEVFDLDGNFTRDMKALLGIRRED